MQELKHSSLKCSSGAEVGFGLSYVNDLKNDIFH